MAAEAASAWSAPGELEVEVCRVVGCVTLGCVELEACSEPPQPSGWPTRLDQGWRARVFA